MRKDTDIAETVSSLCESSAYAYSHWGIGEGAEGRGRREQLPAVPSSKQYQGTIWIDP